VTINWLLFHSCVSFIFLPFTEVSDWHLFEVQHCETFRPSLKITSWPVSQCNCVDQNSAILSGFCLTTQSPLRSLHYYFCCDPSLFLTGVWIHIYWHFCGFFVSQLFHSDVINYRNCWNCSGVHKCQTAFAPSVTIFLVVILVSNISTSLRK